MTAPVRSDDGDDDDDGDDVPTTVAQLVARRAARGDHLLLVVDDQELTYTDAHLRSARLAKGLLAAGAGPGTRVGLFHPNGAEFVVAALATARIGAIVVPFSTFSTADELHALLLGSDVELLISSPSYRSRDHVELVGRVLGGRVLGDRVLGGLGGDEPLHLAHLPALRHVWFDTPPGEPAGELSGEPASAVGERWTVAWLLDAAGGVDDDLLRAVEARVRPGDRLVVVHTSGSTSTPKGVVHQHGPLLRHLQNLNELRRLDEREVLFSNSPFFWVGGFAYSLLGTLLAGSTLVCSNATDAGAALDVIERTRPTMVNGFAASAAHLPNHPTFGDRDLSSIRRGNLWPIMPADACPVDPELRHNMLGMTEAGSVCLASDDETDQPEHRRGSFGRPVPGFEARIVDPDTGDTCPDGVLGELWLRSPYLMEGYLGRERHDTFEPDGWYRTGDLFHRDADGFFYFTGRRGDMIKTAGANVAPREVEAAILDETGLVAHVIGVDDPERGQVVAAALRVPVGRAVPPPDELRAALRRRLSAYKVPRRFLALADHEVPMLSSGKLDARALAERFHDG